MTHSLLYRTAAIVIHGVLNIILVSYLLNFDTTDSWLSFTAFLLGVMGLLVVFTGHLVSFISFLQTKP